MELIDSGRRSHALGSLNGRVAWIDEAGVNRLAKRHEVELVQDRLVKALADPVRPIQVTMDLYGHFIPGADSHHVEGVAEAIEAAEEQPNANPLLADHDASK